MINPNLTINNSSINAVKAKVELYNGSTLVQACTCSDALQSFTVDRDEGSNKFFGYGVCQAIKVDLIDLNRTLNIEKGYRVEDAFGDGTNFVYPHPTFYVNDVKRDEDTNGITITAYDALYGAAAHTFTELGLTKGYTVQSVAEACARVLGLSGISKINISGTDTSFSTYYAEGANFGGDETLRVVLNAIAEATQTIYYIDNNNKLVFKRLSTGAPVYTITKEDYFNLSTGANIKLDAICHATELGDNIVAGDSSGATAYVRDNPFWNLRDDVTTLLQKALAAVSGISIYEFECDEWVGNYLLEIGDRIGLTTEDGNIIYSYVLNDVIEYSGTLEETTQWSFEKNENESASNPISLGEILNQTKATVDKQNKTIQLVVSETAGNTETIGQINLTLEGITQDISELVEADKTITKNYSTLSQTVDSLSGTVGSHSTEIQDLHDEDDALTGKIQTNTEQIGSLELTANGLNASIKETNTNTTTKFNEIYGSIESLTKEVNLKMTANDVTIAIENEISNGVDKVRTSTGFSFDSDGLTISKSDSEISTQITEDGMTITKGYEDVLVADNQGVRAEDLHATTFLIIGNNSRLEDYNGRTACFWIGGNY